MKSLFYFLFFFLLLGCLGFGIKDCKTDKSCLRGAFLKCEKTKGIWENGGRNFQVQILEKSGEDCQTSIKINESISEIGGKDLTCSVPLLTNRTFEIATNCNGTLRDFY